MNIKNLLIVLIVSVLAGCSFTPESEIPVNFKTQNDFNNGSLLPRKEVSTTLSKNLENGATGKACYDLLVEIGDIRCGLFTGDSSTSNIEVDLRWYIQITGDFNEIDGVERRGFRYQVCDKENKAWCGAYYGYEIENPEEMTPRIQQVITGYSASLLRTQVEYRNLLDKIIEIQTSDPTQMLIDQNPEFKAEMVKREGDIRERVDSFFSDSVSRVVPINYRQGTDFDEFTDSVINETYRFLKYRMASIIGPNFEFESAYSKDFKLKVTPKAEPETKLKTANKQKPVKTSQTTAEYEFNKAWGLMASSNYSWFKADQSQILKHFKKAASLGHKKAQYNLNEFMRYFRECSKQSLGLHCSPLTPPPNFVK